LSRLEIHEPFEFPPRRVSRQSRREFDAAVAKPRGAGRGDARAHWTKGKRHAQNRRMGEAVNGLLIARCTLELVK